MTGLERVPQVLLNEIVDGTYLVREFVDQFDEADLVQLPNYRIYLKLMIDGMPSNPFSARTLKPA
jgi:hypothetical protein